MLRIRGHHLLCILGFRGRGYDSAFVENMGRVEQAIRSRPELQLTVRVSCDDICAACPHAQDGMCQKHNGAEEATREMDRAVLSRLELKSGDTLTVREAYDRVLERIGVEDIVENLCTECEWRGLGFCADGLRALQGDDFFGKTAGS